MTQDNCADLQALLEWCQEEHEPLSIHVDRITLFSLVSSLQLSRRHPHFPESTAIIIDKLMRDLLDLMPEDIQALSEKGNDPRFDVPATPKQEGPQWHHGN